METRPPMKNSELPRCLIVVMPDEIDPEDSWYTDVQHAPSQELSADLQTIFERMPKLSPETEASLRFGFYPEPERSLAIAQWKRDHGK
jgi:hypothetical protein